MQAHKSRKVRAFTGVNLFFCFVSQSSVNFLLIRVIQFIVFLIQLFEGWYDLLNHLAHHLFFNLYYTYRTFGRFMTDLYCRFWILVWQTAFIDISSLQFTCGREKTFFGMSFFKIPRLPSHSQMDEQLPRAFKQSFNQFHGTAADQFWRWCRDIADVNLFHLNHQRRALIGEPEVFNLSRCLARLCTFRISTSLDFHLYFPTFLISTF